MKWLDQIFEKCLKNSKIPTRLEVTGRDKGVQYDKITGHQELTIDSSIEIFPTMQHKLYYIIILIVDYFYNESSTQDQLNYLNLLFNWKKEKLLIHLDVKLLIDF